MSAGGSMWQERWQLPRASAVYPNVSCGMKSLPKVGHAPVQHLRSGVCTVWDAESNGGGERRGGVAPLGRGVGRPPGRVFFGPRGGPRFATSLADGVAVVEVFDAAHAALTNKELAERSGLSKATVSRLSL